MIKCAMYNLMRTTDLGSTQIRIVSGDTPIYDDSANRKTVFLCAGITNKI
jgi:hypothetical protein